MHLAVACLPYLEKQHGTDFRTSNIVTCLRHSYARLVTPVSREQRAYECRFAS